ncbi:MAG: glycosyltransferase family 4 protein [Anaerolineales bacterium]|nr:glycosyltransferase family 4 protein [Anaerolineales bacterium]
MRILFVADGRSPTAQNWIRHFAQRDEVYLASTFEGELDFPVQKLELTPVAFSALKKQTSRPTPAASRTLSLRTRLRQLLGPFTIPTAAKKLSGFIQEVQPDLIHALRIPYEGMLTAEAIRAGKFSSIPFIVSVWGNDFTLHAPSTPLMQVYTRRVMRAVSGLHADTERDIRLGREWGLGEDKLTLVAPGNGGVRRAVFYPPVEPVKNPVIINPRGFRAYIRNESFFRAIPLVLEKYPQAKFICASMQGEAQAEAWVRELGIGHAVQLLAPLAHVKMGELFRTAQIVVSPSVHDGSPNALLEALACGCFPIAGDLDSIREWITPGENGLLINPNSPQEMAAAILLGLENADLRRAAAGLNVQLIAAKAGYEANLQKAEDFYRQVLAGRA